MHLIILFLHGFPESKQKHDVMNGEVATLTIAQTEA